MWYMQAVDNIPAGVSLHISQKNTLILLNCHLYSRGMNSKNRSCDTRSSESGSIFQLDVNESEYTMCTLSLLVTPTRSAFSFLGNLQFLIAL